MVGPIKRVGIVSLFILTACSAHVGDSPGGPDSGSEGTDAGVSGPDGGTSATGFTRYPSDVIRSPITPSVTDALTKIYARSATPNDGVFMKVGASGTVSNYFLDCFTTGPVDLDGRSEMQSIIDYYNTALAAGDSSWERTTLAAKIGRSATWAISGDPSPLDQEIAAINPRVALVNYGTNDMSLGITYETALWPFVSNFTALLDQLQSAGIIPIITGLNPRGDDANAARWVPTYNAITRAIAEARQLPYINLYLASVDLVDMGLVGDGLHGNAFNGGACVFTADGLQFNYNIRNMVTAQTLSTVKDVVLDDNPAPDTPGAGFAGAGAPDDAFVVDRLPFTHSASTATSPSSRIDGYPACDTGQNESGPEYYYRLELTQTTPLRILVLDGDGVDVDIHLLAGGANASDCIARHNRIIERTLEAGTYYIAVDSYVNANGDVQSGDYSLVVVECEPGDTRCQ